MGEVTFLWPEVLAGLALLPLLAWMYWRALRRPGRLWVLHAVLATAARAQAARPAYRRHLPAVLLGGAVAAALVAAARPIYPWPEPVTREPMVLVIDVSRSMDENDIKPSRIEATRTAAKDFIRALPRGVHAGVVSFGNYATVVVPLTGDRARLLEGLDSLTLQLRTALGDGLMEGLRVLEGEGNAGGPGGRDPWSAPGAGSVPGAAVPPGSGPSSDGRARGVMILLSDGRASNGVDPIEAGAEAKRRGVRVYTVGVGTAADPSTFRSGYWGVLDEATLRRVAETTGGEYFRAYSAGELRQIYRMLGRMLAWVRRPTEVSALAAVTAAVLTAGALGVALGWSRPAQ